MRWVSYKGGHAVHVSEKEAEISVGILEMSVVELDNRKFSEIS